MSTKKLPKDIVLSDVMCPICLSILVEPVTMPCSHSLCMPCFNENVAKTALACPLCRKRISVWVRRVTKTNKLIDVLLWNKIKEKFPQKVAARSSGEDDFDRDAYLVPAPKICAPGEIRQEYETLVAQQEEERTKRQTEEEIASSRLIQLLQEEERMKLRDRHEQQQRLCQDDETVAEQLKEEEKKLASPMTHRKSSTKTASTPARGPMDIYIGQLTPRTPTSGKKNLKKHSDMTKVDQRDLPPSPSCSTPTTSRSVGATQKSISYNDTDGLDTKIVRQLREIMSSQSSESESEDIWPTSRLSTPKHNRNSGKENVGTPNSGKGKGKFKKKTLTKNSEYREDKDDSVLRKPPEGEPNILQNGDQDSDATDIEEDLNSRVATKKEDEDLSELIKEQQMIEARIKQEEEDRLLAEALQREFNQVAKVPVDRRRGTEDEYKLRHRLESSESNNSPKQKKSGKRQSTLMESLAKRHKHT